MLHVPRTGEAFKAILDAVMDEMDADNCSIMLKDSHANELCIKAARSKKEERSVFYPEHSHGGNGKRFKMGEGIAGWVFQNGHAVMVNDVDQDPRFVKILGFNGQLNSLICFPLKEKEEIVGVFNLSHSKRGAFNEGDQLVLAYVANQVGSVLTSSRYFLEIQRMPPLLKGTSSPVSSTFIEAGEKTLENGIFIYSCEKTYAIKKLVDQVADTDVTVLILGESGVGKEVVAQSIHKNSFRREYPFIKVNCAAIPSELLESELFGYEKGAFTGAYRMKPGKFELAQGGTIFLDEIVEMSPALQAKLLQVIQDKEFSRLGGRKDIRVDARVLAATNQDIEKCVNNGRFREDLYYRINVVAITIPPLRDRKEEIPIFIECFLNKYMEKYRITVKPFSEPVMKILMDYQWKGNVRELENLIQRYVVIGDEKIIIKELGLSMKANLSQAKMVSPPPIKARPSLREVHDQAVIKAESEIIRKALEMTNCNRKEAAALLSIGYKTLLYKIKRCNFDKTLLPYQRKFSISPMGLKK